MAMGLTYLRTRVISVNAVCVTEGSDCCSNLIRGRLGVSPLQPCSHSLSPWELVLVIHFHFAPGFSSSFFIPTATHPHLHTTMILDSSAKTSSNHSSSLSKLSQNDSSMPTASKQTQT